MSGFAITRERYGRQSVRPSPVRAKEYLRNAALVDLGCAVLGVFVAVQLRFHNDVTPDQTLP